MNHKRLNQFLNNNMTRSFEWGAWDCCLFACDCVEQLAGFDPASVYRGRYSTEIGAARVLKKRGHTTVEHAFTEFFGPLQPKLLTSRGDVVLVETQNSDAAGIFANNAPWVVTPEGLSQVPLSSVKGCWKIADYKGGE